MKKIINRQTILASAAVLTAPMLWFGSCSDDMLNVLPPEDARLPFEVSAAIDQVNDTRADETGFADGDRFGVFVVNYNGDAPGTLTLSDNQANNVAFKYSADNNKWQPATGIYWRDKVTPADVYGYYPFDNGMGDVESYRFEVDYDQSKPASEGKMSSYEASDFLWAKAPSARPGEKVSLSFCHIMAGVRVYLLKGEGFGEDEWETLTKVVCIDNTLRSAEVNLTDGKAIPTGSADKNIMMNPEEGCFRAVVVPQTVEAGKTTASIVLDGVTYRYNRSGGMNYTAGKLHDFTIRIDKKGEGIGYALTLTNENITDWVSDKASHDFEANSYLVVNVPTAGTLKECIIAAGCDYNSVQNLKVTGQLTDEDFRFMRDEMSILTAVNLKDAKIVNIEFNIPTEGVDYWNWPTKIEDDRFPDKAFLNKESLRRIILPEGIRSIGQSSLENLRLTSTLIIPESAVYIGKSALAGLGEECTLVLPNSIEYIDDNAFYNVLADFQLNFSNKLIHIGNGAFFQAYGATGIFSLPPNLKYLGNEAFKSCGHDLTGEIRIPENITEINYNTFYDLGISKSGINLYLHDGVKKINDGAFQNIRIRNNLSIPENTKYIGDYAFMDTKFLGSVSIPDKLSYIGQLAFAFSTMKGDITYPSSLTTVIGGKTSYSGFYEGGAFATTLISSIDIGDNILQIESKAFENCSELKHVKIGRNVAHIGEQAFSNLPQLSTIICLAEEPPIADESSFRDISDKAILEVPESSVAAYRNATGWNKFQNITAHHELAFNIPEIVCLDKGVTREGIIRTEGPWTCKASEEWIHVTPDHSDYKEQITISIDPLPDGSDSREGTIVFSLKDKDYTTYTSVRQLAFEHKEDTEIVLQKATAGAREIPLFIVGEGFNADDIVNGTYINTMNETMEQFFDIEPYKTYRDYFTVTTAIACSPDNGVSDIKTIKSTCFDSKGVEPNADKLKDYVRKVSNVAHDDISNATIIMVANYNNFEGWSDIDIYGCRLACIGKVNDTPPYDQRGLVQHYAGGAAFAGLGEENVLHFEHIKGCLCPRCNSLSCFKVMKQRGFYENLTLSSKMSDAPWKDFIFHPKYSNIVDMWEGGFNHLRGVWRSENQSVMGTYIAYFNTISRYAIYKEIMRRSGKKGSLEDFIENDKIEIPQ